MSEVNEATIARIAQLARVAFSEADAAQTTGDVQRVLRLVDGLQAAETEGVEPTSQVTGLTDVLREDIVVRSSVSPEDLLARAPRHEAGYIVVKRVLQ